MIQIVLLRKILDGRLMHQHPVGFPAGLSVPNLPTLFTSLGEIQEKLRTAHPDNLKNVYFTAGHHSGCGGPKPSRTKLTFETQTILPIDIDYIDQARIWEYLPLVARLLGVNPAFLIFTSTGNGIHVLAHLKTPIRSSQYIDQTRPHYNELVYRINQAMKEAGLLGNADPAVWDPSRILRLPHSINEKLGVSKEAQLLQCPAFTPLELDLIQVSGLEKLESEKITSSRLKKVYPRPDFPYVMSHCEFLKWVSVKPEEVHEPQYMSLLGLLAAMAPTDKVEYQDREVTPKEFARLIFEGAQRSQSLQQGDFEQKWEHGVRYGAPKCQTVSNTWIGGCEKCPHFTRIITPLALKSDEHISSAPNGYWEIGRNGPSHPHYADLAQLYRQENSFFAAEPSRIFTFEKTHYLPTDPLMVKCWVEKKVGHVERLREAHCIEFVKKVLRTGALPTLQVADLFENSVQGKVNCRNGVVDIATGELLPHSTGFGFQYVLPYDFERDEVSDFFVEWLTEMMENRIELMEAVLDLMAYCLWPTYDDHLFCYLVGEGANGKGTLLHILQELLGKANYSAISMQQLVGTRFATASLEGKLANLSEESSGYELSFESLNLIKDLSAGGEIQVERKGQHPFQLRNRAKLIFSANLTPKFKEQGHAVRRRLLVIPFDYRITAPDPRVEKRLLADVPKIFSMLIRRIQENVAANGGRFLVSRGGVSGQAAQEKVLLAGNSVVEWAAVALESRVELGEGQYIGAAEAYERYVAWCDLNGHKRTNSAQFGYQMVHGALSPVVKESKRLRVGTKQLRVYPHTQWRDPE